MAPATTIEQSRKPNSVYRTREHPSGAEVDRLIDAAEPLAAATGDAIMILVAFRHGLRSSELVDLRWDEIDFDHDTLHVRRVKKGTPATHTRFEATRCGSAQVAAGAGPKSPLVFTGGHPSCLARALSLRPGRRQSRE